MVQLLVPEECRAIAAFGSEIIGVDDTNTPRTIRLLRISGGAMQRPIHNKNGISGWCILDGYPLRKRVHNCAQYFCKSRYHPAKYCEMYLPNAHVRVYLHALHAIALHAFTVPLIENHASTRERWSLSTVTDSNKRRVEKRLPGFEIMFKADGDVKKMRLQANLRCRGCWGRTGEWEMWPWDAYAAGHGASIIAQTNDSVLHKPGRAVFVEEQSELMLPKAHLASGGMVDLTEKKCIKCITPLAKVLSRKDLRLQACQGYKTTGTTIDSVVADVKRRFDAGDLPWEYEVVQGLIRPYPKGGKNDSGPGQQYAGCMDISEPKTATACPCIKLGGLRQLVLMSVVLAGVTAVPIAQAGDETVAEATEVSLAFGFLWMLCFVAIDKYFVKRNWAVQVGVPHYSWQNEYGEYIGHEYPAFPRNVRVPTKSPCAFPEPMSEPEPDGPTPAHAEEPIVHEAFKTRYGSKCHNSCRCPSLHGRYYYRINPVPAGPDWCKLCSAKLCKE